MKSHYTLNGWLLAACASMLLVACGDGKGDEGSAGSNSGGTAGSAAGGTAGSATGGSAGSATGGSAGSATGGSAGSATGGSGGSATGGSGGSATGGSGGSATGGSGGSATGGSGGSATGGTGGSGMNDSALGTECAVDANCGAGLKCSSATMDDPILGGGPANGYCTKTCAADADCPGKGSVCVADPNGNGQCFLGCEAGLPELMFINDPLDPSKCHGREDLRCQTLDGIGSICLPSCGNDAQCDGGRKCDPGSGLCVTTPSMGKLLGEKCDPMAMVNECAGICITIGSGGGMDMTMCTSPCTMAGELPNANECAAGAKTPGGLCIYSPAGTGAGDIGFCAQGCAMQDECQTDDFFCFNIGLPDNGLCLGSVACATDANCTSVFQGSKCIATKNGKFCMSEDYPLGTVAP